MGIANEKLYYGAALCLLMESLDHATVKTGAVGHQHAFSVRHNAIDAGVVLKYRSGRGPWSFQFSRDEAAALDAMATLHGGARVFAALVCRQDGVCCTSLRELQELFGQDSVEGLRISVRRPRGGQYHVSMGRDWALHSAIPQSAWPSRMFTEDE